MATANSAALRFAVTGFFVPLSGPVRPAQSTFRRLIFRRCGQDVARQMIESFRQDSHSLIATVVRFAAAQPASQMTPHIHRLVKHADDLQRLVFPTVEHEMMHHMQRAVARANMVVRDT